MNTSGSPPTLRTQPQAASAARASADGRGVILRVRVQPGARRAAIEGTVSDAVGEDALRVAVTAAPEAGKANAALIALLAKAWKLPKSAFTIEKGATGRRKTLRIAGDPATLLRLIAQAADTGGRAR